MMECGPGYTPATFSITSSAASAGNGGSRTGVQCILCPAGTYSPAGTSCLLAPTGSFSPSDGLTHFLDCPGSTEEGATFCADSSNDSIRKDNIEYFENHELSESIIRGNYLHLAGHQMQTASFSPPATDQNWTGYVIQGKENSHSQVAYVARLFDRIVQTGLYGDYVVGYFNSYDSDTGAYYVAGGVSCDTYGIYSSGEVYFLCDQKTSFAVVEVSCYYTMHFHGPTFCPNGVYPYVAGTPTLSPTTGPTSSPTLYASQLPAYAMTEDYVKEVLLSLDGGWWAYINGWNDGTALDDFYSVYASIENSTGVRRLAAPIEIYHLNPYYYNMPYTAMPTELELLKDCVSVLSISDSNLWSTLPDFFANFTYLEALILYDNYLYGTIPAGLGSNSVLDVIYLALNGFSGPIPEDLFLHASIVSVGSNFLTGSLPSSLGANLETYYAYTNYLTGSIPSSAGDTSIRRMDLSVNLLSGAIPVSLCKLNILVLYLESNSLGCYEPCLNVGITDVTSYYSRCRSDVDTVMCDLSDAFNVSAAISSIYVPGTSSYYETAHPLGYAWELWLSYSWTDADAIQVSFGCYSDLVTVLMRIYDDDGNMLYDAGALGTDTVPGCGIEAALTFSGISFVRFVYTNWQPLATYGFYVTVTPLYYASGWSCNNSYSADGRRLSNADSYAGDYCSWYGISCAAGVSITAITLDALGLAGTLPASLSLLDSVPLQTLSLGYNSISGTLPPSLGNLTSLAVLNLAFNRFSGTLPTELAQLTELETLILSTNSLSGSVPSFLATMTTLTMLDLSTNLFGGKMSNGLCSLVETQDVVVKLDGTFITCYESHCYQDSDGNNSGTIIFDHSVEYCAPTSMPTSYPTASLVANEQPIWTAGPIAGLTIGIVIVLLGLCLLRQTTAVKYLGHPIHHTIVTGKPVTEELLSAHQDQVMVLVAGESVIDLIFNRGLKCSITGVVLGKLIMMRMVEEEAKIANLAILKENGPDNAETSQEHGFNLEEFAHKGLQMISSAGHKVAEEAEMLKEEVMDTIGLGRNPFTLGLEESGEIPRSPHHRRHGRRDSMIGAATTSPLFEDWVRLIQEEDPRSQEAVYYILQALPAKISALSECTDDRGRRSIDIASFPCKEIMRRCSYLSYRYDIKPGPLEHVSATSAVVFAVDHGKWSFEPVDPAVVANELVLKSPRSQSFYRNLDADNVSDKQPKDVCLKFMRNKEQYLTEIDVRDRAQLDSAYVIAVLRSFDGDNVSVLSSMDADDEALMDSTRFRKGAISKGFDAYPYCIIMEKADQSLKRIIDHNHIVGNDWDTIKTMFRQITHAVEHMHDRQLIHGDLKPMNIMQAGNRMLLIDLDASAGFSEGNVQFAGAKYSSAYLPPELIGIGSNGNACVRVPPIPSSPTFPTTSLRAVRVSFGSESPEDDGCNLNQSSSGRFSTKSRDFSAHFDEANVEPPPYSLVTAHPSLDMWSLGCLLYLLCTGMTLFRATVEDNVGSDVDLRALMEWSVKTKIACISQVEDKLARNLISLLLSKDPKRRPDCSHVLSHPFLAGKHPGRLQGELPQHDVFLSYRVSSDSAHVKHLHDMLEARGLNVWWDKKCLLPGQPWEEGFCAGLANSGHFVCLLSRGAVNSEKPWENFSKLEAGSRCDNVLLEWRLALELKRRGMVEGVFPILIGDIIRHENSHHVEYSHYFRTGCGPKELPPWAVVSVEQKLREHLDREGLGAPYENEMSVSDVMKEVLANQGGFVVHDPDTAWNTVVDSIVRMVHVTAEKHMHDGHHENHESPLSTTRDIQDVELKYAELLRSYADVHKQLLVANARLEQNTGLVLDSTALSLDITTNGKGGPQQQRDSHEHLIGIAPEAVGSHH
jgi:serine/threonine protein kinase